MDIDQLSFYLGVTCGIAFPVLIYIFYDLINDLRKGINRTFKLRRKKEGKVDIDERDGEDFSNYPTLIEMSDKLQKHIDDSRSHVAKEEERHEKNQEHLKYIIQVLKEKLENDSSLSIEESAHYQHEANHFRPARENQNTALDHYVDKNPIEPEGENFQEEGSLPPEYDNSYVGRDSSASLSPPSRTQKKEANLVWASRDEAEPAVHPPTRHESAPKSNDWSEEDNIWNGIYMEYNQMLTSADPSQQKEFLKKHNAVIYTMLNYENRGKDLWLPPQLRAARERDREHFLALPAPKGSHLFLLSATASAENNVLTTATMPGKVPWLWGIFQANNSEKLEVVKPAIMQNGKIVRTGVVNLPQY